MVKMAQGRSQRRECWRRGWWLSNRGVLGIGAEADEGPRDSSRCYRRSDGRHCLLRRPKTRRRSVRRKLASSVPLVLVLFNPRLSDLRDIGGLSEDVVSVVRASQAGVTTGAPARETSRCLELARGTERTRENVNLCAWNVEEDWLKKPRKVQPRTLSLDLG